VIILVPTSKQARQDHLNETLKGSDRTRAVAPSYAAGRAYNSQLQRMLIELRKDINRELLPAIKQTEPQYTADGWSDVIARVFQSLAAKWLGDSFVLWAEHQAGRFVNHAVNVGKRRFVRSAPGIGINLYGETPEINDYIEASTAANVKLIKSIPAQHLDQIETMVMSNMRSGMRSGSIAKQLVEKFRATKSRAKFIARDQTSKINADITKKRQQHAGFEFFKWIDSDDDRVRKRHEKIASADVGFGPGVYRWDDLPISDSGQRISPGQDYECRCTAKPMTRKMVDRLIK